MIVFSVIDCECVCVCVSLGAYCVRMASYADADAHTIENLLENNMATTLRCLALP